MRNTSLYSGLLLLLLGCSSAPPLFTDEHPFTISHIHVELLGKNLENQPALVNVCQGFILTEKQIHDFFVYASYIKDTNPSPYYDRLPCYSSGTALINDRKYQWIIRAGGIGEFYNDKDRFLKVCGKNCCTKVASVC
ncbi:MAG: hypothetical protein HY080_02625 [Gammaproteobacteria bacterium]|nr:hypothetical protein [Gammaproteobacteria bacterium]